jgi:hypothetical protein
MRLEANQAVIASEAKQSRTMVAADSAGFAGALRARHSRSKNGVASLAYGRSQWRLFASS